MSDSEKPKSWQERKQSIKHKWLVPFVFPEWLCERFSYFLGQWALLDILGHAGRLTILVAVIFYFAESGSRRKAKHYQAWQVINLAQGKPGSGGRMDALQDLCSDGISLAGVDISKAYLPKLNLENADLLAANLAGTDLSHANLAEADLRVARLTEANLRDVNLAGARLSDANLTGANLWDANLAGANLWEANLTGADLFRANLTGANLRDVNLAGADLTRSNLRDINEWRHIKSIEQANIYGVKNPPKRFREWATEQGAVIIEANGWKKILLEITQHK